MGNGRSTWHSALQVEPIDVVLRLEKSSKWPDELDAVRSTVTAFLIRLAQCLEKQVGRKDGVIAKTLLDQGNPQI